MPKPQVLSTHKSAHLLCIVEPRQEPDLAGLLLAHQARQLRRPIARIKAAHFRPRLAEHRIVRRDLPQPA